MSLSTAQLRSHSFIVKLLGGQFGSWYQDWLPGGGGPEHWVGLGMLQEEEASGRTPILLWPPQPGSYCPHCIGCAGTGRKNPSPAAGTVKAEERMRGSPQDS